MLEFLVGIQKVLDSVPFLLGLFFLAFDSISIFGCFKNPPFSREYLFMLNDLLVQDVDIPVSCQVG